MVSTNASGLMIGGESIDAVMAGRSHRLAVAGADELFERGLEHKLVA